MSDLVNPPTGRVLRDVLVERGRQDMKWGEQNHPDGTGGERLAGEATLARNACKAAAASGSLSWRHILREEYAEALAESDPANLRAELVQVAAVATAWIENIDRRAP